MGTRAWIGLFLGRDNQDPLFLQMKEAEESVLERFVGKSAYPNHGQRVVAGQRLMQASERHLPRIGPRRHGLDGQPRDFYIRQLRDMKGSVEVETLLPLGMAIYARICASTLARAHARSGTGSRSPPTSARATRSTVAIADFSAAYADQNERDYERLQAAVKKGKIKAETGL